ncbi:MAG: hypothetical protein E6H57_06795 [Betaproteobacteria bacterium]|nr:MAG: hypothetical protein E6H57_06795 [Betaproteobacteria bacterium]
MAYRCVVVLVLAIALVGCASRKPATQPAANTAKMPEQAAPPAAASSSSYLQTPGASYSGPLPPMEAHRKINEQDCTQAIDLTAGNLRCR